MPIKNKNAQLSDELLFLITCCQTDPSKDDIEFIHSMLENQLDTKSLLGLASQHGILPLVYKTLKKLHIDDQEHFLKELRSSYIQIAKINMLMSAELIHIMKLLEENDIEALAFKGPTLSQMAYGDITLRQFGDLDILIPIKHLFNAATILLNNGYSLQGSINFLNDPLWIEATKDMTLFHNEKNIVLEMHWKLFHSTFAKHTHNVDLWHKTEKIKINQIDILTLDRNLLLAYLCIHGSRHLWERLEWIVDIDRLIREKDIEWDEVLKFALLFQSKNMLVLGLSLAHMHFGTILPDNIYKMIQTKKVNHLSYIIMDLLKNPISKEQSTADIIRRKSIHASMQDSFYAKMRFWWNVIFQRNYTALLEENIPNKHNSLLNLKRPYELVKKFIFN